MTLLPLITGLTVAILSAILAYILGVQRARYERRDERRDNAIADIFGALLKFHRMCIAASLTAEFRPPDWRDLLSQSYENFLDCYYTRSIWLGHDTRNLIEAYATESKDVYVEIYNEINHADVLADGTKAIDRL